MTRLLAFIVSAGLAVLSAGAADSYIYWIQLPAEEWNVEAKINADYSARVVAINGSEWSYRPEGSLYMNIYSAGEYGPNVGSVHDTVTLNLGDEGDNVAYYIGSGGFTEGEWTYFIELYNDRGVFAHSEGLALTAASEYFYDETALQPPTDYWSAMTFLPAAVPEPNSAMLVLLGCALLGLRRRRTT